MARLSGFVLICSAVGLAGCGPELPETVDVTGTVTYQGKPVAGAQIGFVPKEEGQGALPARGETDESGRFTLRTYVTPGNEADGAMPGAYSVTVQKTEIAENAAALFAKNPAYRPKQLVPAQYTTVQTSKLLANVTEDGENSFEFTLEDAPKAGSR